MFITLSLRNRINLLLGTLLLIVLGTGLVVQLVFARITLVEERDHADRVASQLVRSLASILEKSDDKRTVISGFLKTATENRTGIAGFIPTGDGTPLESFSSPFKLHDAPGWFVWLIDVNQGPARLPLATRDEALGDVIFFSDMTEDIEEKWYTFVALVISSFILTGLVMTIVYFSLNSILGPIHALERGLTVLRSGDYDVRVQSFGAPELVQSSNELNYLAETLGKLNESNRQLLRELVTVGDKERQDISRELHDELGPLLFAIRAHASSIAKRFSNENHQALEASSKLLEAVELVQQANHRILDRLQPSQLKELGLVEGINSILDGPGPRAGNIEIVKQLDERIASLDDVVAQTVYRVVQEGVTNALRHSGASKLTVRVRRLKPLQEEKLPDRISIEVTDNGVGIPTDMVFGKGLSGMSERARALGGSMSVKADDPGTRLLCVIPAADYVRPRK